MKHKFSRMQIVKSTMLGTLLGWLGTGKHSMGGSDSQETDEVNYPSGQKYMGGFSAEKLGKVKLAFIGLGARGYGHCNSFSGLEGVEVVGLCDLYEDLCKRAVKTSTEHGHTPRHYSGNEEIWKKMLKEVRPDAVIVSTPWSKHARMAIEVMQHGAHALVEVPLAVTLKEHWDIVNTAEKTRKHCMMLENVNYGREELLYLNMIRQGVLGELLHGEAAYIHDLRAQMHQVERGTGSWRTGHYINRNGSLYPTHGLGPIAQYMNLCRGEDQFKTLSSFSSPARGRQIYAKEHFEKGHIRNQHAYSCGDINTTIIKTRLGRTILLQWDETSPRPYTRLNLIQGTRGSLAGFPNRMSVEGLTKSTHHWAEGKDFEAIAQKYEHPLWKRLGALARKNGGHGGMDFVMRYRIIECLRNGWPLDQNVYEGAAWSVLGPISERSVATDGQPQKIPDFTRGRWKETEELTIVS